MVPNEGASEWQIKVEGIASEGRRDGDGWT